MWLNGIMLNWHLPKTWRVAKCWVVKLQHKYGEVWTLPHSFCPAFAENERAPVDWCLNHIRSKACLTGKAVTPESAMLQAGQQLCWRVEVARDKGWDEEGVIHRPHWKVLLLPSPAIQTQHITLTNDFNSIHAIPSNVSKVHTSDSARLGCSGLSTCLAVAGVKKGMEWF